MVLVCHAREFVFLKTRKTASTTVEMALEPFCAPPGHVVAERTEGAMSRHGVVGWRMAPPRRRALRGWLGRDWPNHMPAAAVAAHLGPVPWRRYRKLTTVRDPFDRMVSLFHFLVRMPGLLDDFDRVRPAFLRWVKAGRWYDDHDVVHHQGRFVPDLAVRFERLSEDLPRAAAALGLSIDAGSLGHAKSTAATRRGRAVADYFDDEAAEAVRRRMAWVFDNFDYPARPGEAAAPAAAARTPRSRRAGAWPPPSRPAAPTESPRP